MNIEEGIKIIKNMLLHAETQLLDYEAIAIETLLTAYEKEKEKNKITKQMNENLIKALKESISKDKIKPIQIIDLDGKIHNVYKIEEE